uniref:Uncharacterized protein n=1 Tax=viral metagenome TaxID=1070528 RepID=A0A6M3LQG1_9ZZZZ
MRVAIAVVCTMVVLGLCFVGGIVALRHGMTGLGVTGIAIGAAILFASTIAGDEAGE